MNGPQRGHVINSRVSILKHDFAVKLLILLTVLRPIIHDTRQEESEHFTRVSHFVTSLVKFVKGRGVLNFTRTLLKCEKKCRETTKSSILFSKHMVDHIRYQPSNDEIGFITRMVYPQ